MSDVSKDNYLEDNPIQPQQQQTQQSVGNTGVSEGYLPPPNYRVKGTYTSGIRYDRQTALPENKISVSRLVDQNNRTQNFYDLSTKPGELLASFDTKTRAAFIDKLYSRGWYGDKEPEGGLGDNDIEATRNLLYYSNLTGSTWNVVFNTLSRAPITKPGAGSGRNVQVTSIGDLMEIANRTALQTIGRRLNDAEAKRFAASYQGVQRSETDTMAAPSADIYFQQQLEQKYGAESEATKYLNAISNVAKVLGGM